VREGGREGERGWVGGRERVDGKGESVDGRVREGEWEGERGWMGR
jgi:hypothetical protein